MNRAVASCLAASLVLGLAGCGSAPVPIITPFDSRWTYAGTPYPAELSQGTGRHMGVDIAARDGEPVHAAGDGLVTRAGMLNPNCGIGVNIVHANTYLTAYCHLKDVVIESGQTIRRGDRIGHVGRTGAWGNREHLHFELYRQGQLVDPESAMKGCIAAPPTDPQAFIWPVKCL